MPSVSLVVVTYNRKDLLRRILNSVLSQTVKPDHVFIVDNCSQDGTAEMVDSEFSGFDGSLELISLKQNTGGAGGFHEGMKRAFAAGDDYIWLMDDDVEPDPDCLEQLLMAVSDQSPVVMPVRVNTDGRISGQERMQLNFTYPFTDYGSPKLGAVYSKPEDIPDEGVLIGNVPFEGPMMSRQVVEKIGLPDSGFFIVGDDLDYSARIGRHYSIRLVKHARLTRLLSNSVGTSGIDWKVYYYMRNMVVIHMRHGSFAVKCIRIAIYFLKWLKTPLLRFDRQGIRFVLLALWHGLTGKMGKTVNPG